MDCRELESRLEELLDGTLEEDERRRCSRHLERCPSCRELAEPLAAAAAAPPDDLVGAVLARTSGPACGRAEGLLSALLDRELAPAERQLMAAHLERCGECRALAAVMSRLAVDLPLLAELRPDAGFVAAVLAATLPPSVRLRRWWAGVWPRWVSRPRFASEAAFVGTLVLALVFATPGSPLAAVPTKALELARTDPRAQLEAPVAALEESLASRVTTPLAVYSARGRSAVTAWGSALAARSEALAGEVGSWLGTSREQIASLLARADDKAPADESSATTANQETP